MSEVAATAWKEALGQTGATFVVDEDVVRWHVNPGAEAFTVTLEATPGVFRIRSVVFPGDYPFQALPMALVLGLPKWVETGDARFDASVAAYGDDGVGVLVDRVTRMLVREAVEAYGLIMDETEITLPGARAMQLTTTQAVRAAIGDIDRLRAHLQHAGRQPPSALLKDCGAALARGETLLAEFALAKLRVRAFDPFEGVELLRSMTIAEVLSLVGDPVADLAHHRSATENPAVTALAWMATLVTTLPKGVTFEGEMTLAHKSYDNQPYWRAVYDAALALVAGSDRSEATDALLRLHDRLYKFAVTRATRATVELLATAPCPSNTQWLLRALPAYPDQVLPALGRCGDATVIKTLEDGYTGFFVNRTVKDAAVAAIDAIKARHQTVGGLSIAGDGGGSLSVSSDDDGFS